ncbi:MAG: non-canonical purine NTP pyrophosphatase, RdgB/HAM1 family [Candidatus Marinimicrobia bacterium]|nr:non-canonical purine NTP pyrophosphatase, RdgB/HAM1 family [Candidatus Neomarinimicrobiota bacterium]|tara:strand:- start:5681 stop:6298 length:618 start_codon:yes stop_codon:yes gene_type:complete
MITKVVIATHNKDKFKELYKGLKSLNIELLSLDQFPNIGEIIEDGETLEENALIKARTVFELTSIPAIADDTGLEVDALNGAPGVYTARYAGENCSYSDNVNKMLYDMKHIPTKNRSACFKTVMVYVDKKMELLSEGIVKGMIEKKIKGLAGFGYDPIFYVQEKNKTFAEMTLEEKNIISHRGKAIFALKEKLRIYFNSLHKESA